MHGEPIRSKAFEARDAFSDFVVEDLGAAAGDGIESGVAKALHALIERNVAEVADPEDLRGREAVQVHHRESLLDVSEQVFEPLNLQVRVQATLHQDAGAAHLNCFRDLFVDLLEIEDVALGAAGSLDGRVKGAEGAVFGAKIGVINVPVNDVSDHAFRV